MKIACTTLPSRIPPAKTGNLSYPFRSILRFSYTQERKDNLLMYFANLNKENINNELTNKGANGAHKI